MDTTTTGTDPAIITNISEADYRKATGLSQSSLKEFLVSPAHYLASTERTKEPTKAMQFGTAFHANMLADEPSDHYAVKKKIDGRSKEGRAYNEQFALENAGKIILDSEEHDKIISMADSVMAHEFAGSLIQSLTHKEFAVFGTINGVRVKGLIDGYNEKEGIVIDLKTAEDASPSGFRKAIFDRKYDLQVAQYTWLLSNAGKPVNAFYFIAVEKEPPFAVGVYKLNPNTLLYSMNYWEDSIKRFKVCQETGNYPAYSENPVEITL
jgi:hypothetical protein